MSDKDTICKRTLEAAHLQMIEGNPLDAEDIAMFEMFDREGFSTEEQLDYVRKDLTRRAREKEEFAAFAATSRR
ncbi:hypothetical protein ACFFP0_11045 [Rhizobium puerariae]|uniref:Antitoxin VbhA domain-containing protein n=1 Tax=Rhizobium puerariae TaxID=1585791 RepID=A0ABV6AH06_9HYPH